MLAEATNLLLARHGERARVLEDDQVELAEDHEGRSRPERIARIYIH